MADVLWTVAMAIDVYLVVYRRYEAEALRKLEIYYIIIITSIVAIPAVVFLFIHTPNKGPMYGSVTVSSTVLTQTYMRLISNPQFWCSISPNWVLFRVLFYYGPIWYASLIINHNYFALLTDDVCPGSSSL
jgi:hypothetical protein